MKVINTNFLTSYIILHRFRNIAFDRSKINGWPEYLWRRNGSVGRTNVTDDRQTDGRQTGECHLLTSTEHFTEFDPGEPVRRRGGGYNARGVAKYSDFGPIEGYISETAEDRR